MKKVLIFVLFSILSVGYCLAEEPTAFVNKPAPSMLPHVTSSMLSAGYWIARHPDSQKIVMTKEQIVNLNHSIQNERRLTKDIFSLVDQMKTEDFLDTLRKPLTWIKEKGYFTIENVRYDMDLYEKVKRNLHLSAVVLGVQPKYGLIVHFADQRFLPTEKGLYEKRGDIDFDELQNSGLDLGTAVAIIHQSLDKKWFYVLSELSDGWVAADRIAMAKEGEAKNFKDPKDFIVITAPRAEIYLDEVMINYYDFTRMGQRYPLLEEKNDCWVIKLPMKDKAMNLQFVKGYISKVAAHRGFLSYTPKTIYTQAFAMLNKPYGWGDMNAEQDCSRFLQMIFATVGINLPRDSKDQARAGELIFSFDDAVKAQEKIEKLKNAVGGLTILPLKGHIMLYLGMVDGVPFVIHETSGYTQNKEDSQIKYIINRAVVSDLSLGEASNKGSLLKRLKSIVGIYSK